MSNNLKDLEERVRLNLEAAVLVDVHNLPMAVIKSLLGLGWYYYSATHLAPPGVGGQFDLLFCDHALMGVVDDDKLEAIIDHIKKSLAIDTDCLGISGSGGAVEYCFMSTAICNAKFEQLLREAFAEFVGDVDNIKFNVTS